MVITDHSGIDHEDVCSLFQIFYFKSGISLGNRHSALNEFLVVGSHWVHTINELHEHESALINH
jgi:hypothetical protein